MNAELEMTEETVFGWELVERSYDAAEHDELIRLRVVSDAISQDGADPLITARYHAPVDPDDSVSVPGVVWVGGVGGGLTGPADGMYPRLARALAEEGVASLRVDYRQPRELEPSVIDCVIGVGFLREEGVGQVGLVGHSSGGAVVITVGAVLEGIATVVALATQTYGTDLATDLAPASLLLVHGTDDPVLPARCSIDVERRALTRTDLQLLPEAGHSFEGQEEEATRLVRDWLRRELGTRVTAVRSVR